MMTLPKDLAITFPFDPVPAMRPTPKAMKLLRIPDAKLSLKQVQFKNRIRRFQQFKFACAMYANSKKFKLPNCDWHMIFYIGTKDKTRWNKPHMMKPDRDNLEKCLQDALAKSDCHVWDGRVTKYWSEPEKARVEIWV